MRNVCLVAERSRMHACPALLLAVIDEWRIVYNVYDMLALILGPFWLYSGDGDGTGHHP